MTDIQPVYEPLPPHEAAELRTLEQTVGQGMDIIAQGVRESADALKEIRERRLYRATHKRFEDYCRDRWGQNVQAIRRLIREFDVRHQISEEAQSNENHAVIKSVANEASPSVILELAKVKQEQRINAILAANKLSGGKQITAANVQTAVNALTRHPGADRPANPVKDAWSAVYGFSRTGPKPITTHSTGGPDEMGEASENQLTVGELRAALNGLDDATRLRFPGDGGWCLASGIDRKESGFLSLF